MNNIRLLGKPCTRKIGKDLLVGYPLLGGNDVCGYFVFQRDREVQAAEDATIRGVLEVFSNYYALLDISLRDANGYLVIPFSTELAQLSPLTRNHKVRHVEVDLQGVLLGDPTARVYLRMSGTGSGRHVGNDTDLYLFDSRLGVVNASVNGARPYDQEVYRNYRFRDRPLVNTMWEVVLNTRDEPANRDVQLQTLTDVRLLFYYSDFTAF